MCSYGKLKAKLQLTDPAYRGGPCIPYSSTLHAIWELFPFVFRINDNNLPGQTTLTILENVCKERGWKEFGEDDGKLPGGNLLGWNLWWRSVVMVHTQTRSLYSWQYTNHIPRAIHFCNKEYLASFARIMEDRFGDIFRFCPKTFTLPRELNELEMEHEDRSRMNLLQHISNSAKNLVEIPTPPSIQQLSCPTTAKNRQTSILKGTEVCSGGDGEVDAMGDRNSTEKILGRRNKSNKSKSEDIHLKKRPATPSTCTNTNTDTNNNTTGTETGTGTGQNSNSNNNRNPVWICKPVGKSQGRGIVLIDDLTNLPDHPVTIVQEYISKPLLISGYKFDLRLYVVIVSVSPLTIYAYREGLTRFATEPYDLQDLQNTYSHLTNSSINKLSPGYEKDKEGVGHGCKWTLRRLRQYLAQAKTEVSGPGPTDWLMWQKIMSIIVLTILGEIGQQVGIPGTRNNFEFLGYDILIDTDLQPWLLETNLSPGLGGDCSVDELVKKPMLHDLFDLLGLPDGRPYVSLVSMSSLQKCHSSAGEVIAIDESSNTAIKFTSEAELLQEVRCEMVGPDQVPDLIKKRRSSTSGSISVTETLVKEKITVENDSSNNGCDTAVDSKQSQDVEAISKPGEKTTKKLQQQQTKQRSGLKEKDKISPILQKRLLDATIIYSQNLATSLVKNQKSKARSSSSQFKTSRYDLSEYTSTTDADASGKINFLGSTDWGSRDTAAGNAKFAFQPFSSIATGNNAPSAVMSNVNLPSSKKARSTIPHRPGVGLKRRSWYASPEKYGDWIRIFPFDSISFQMTRGHLNTDVKVIINHLKLFMKTAEEVFVSEPGMSDEFYAESVTRGLHWNSQLWLPPK